MTNDDSAGDDSGEGMEGYKVLAKLCAFCLRVGRTKIANETVNETVCCSGHWRKTQQQGLGTWETGEMVIECKESSQNRPQGTLCAVFWTFTAGGQFALAFLFMKSQPEPRRL